MTSNPPLPSSSSLPAAILVHEYVTGGGWPGATLPPGLTGEALSILRALLTDLRAWGRFPVVATRDVRLECVPLPADRVVDLEARVYPTSLIELAGECGAALVIAPESEGVHAGLIRALEDAGVFLLGSRPEGVALAADKWRCHRLFAAAGLATAETVRAAPAAAAEAAARLGYPVVVKPIRGAGCGGVGLATDEATLAMALEQPALRGGGSLLVQRYVTGTAASVSLLVAGGRSVVLSLNEQHVHSGIPFTYDGGVASLPHPWRAAACDLAQRAAALVPGLQGYVGVDLVLGQNGARLIEINPRPTTSYVGLRRVVGLNLAAAIWDACRDGILPGAVAEPRSVAFERGTI